LKKWSMYSRMSSFTATQYSTALVLSRLSMASRFRMFPGSSIRTLIRPSLFSRGTQSSWHRYSYFSRESSESGTGQVSSKRIAR
jgi:hypothetical protein